MPDEIDPRQFRTAAGQFMTGVTIVTTTGPDGTRAGFTANSFSSISLDPPLVGFSLGLNSESFSTFAAAGGFVVNVLAASQVELAIRFAAKGIDRFAGVEVEEGWNGLPVIAGSLATFECKVVERFPGGDHLIFIGEVQRLATGDPGAGALGYFRGRYVVSDGLEPVDPPLPTLGPETGKG